MVRFAANHAATEIVTMAIRDLRPASYNPRRIDNASLAALGKSIDRFGVVEPIIFNRRSGLVVGGHQRLKVLRSKKIASTSVVVVDLDETEERALNVALNSPKLSGEFTGALEDLLAEIEAADAQIFRELRLDELLGDQEPRVYLRDPDEAPAAAGETSTKTGDLFTLGNHRLLCGDCTIAADVATVLGRRKVESLVTDPPYGVNYVRGKAHLRAEHGGTDHRDIANDTGRNYREWFREFLSGVPWADYATFYIFMSGLELHNLRMAIEDCDLKWGDYLVWVKNALVLGRKDYNQRTELIAVGDATGFPGDAPEVAEFVVYGWPERHRFFGPAKRTNVLEFRKPLASKLHPTMKPVELMRQLLEDGSAGGAIVYEPFAGSGSTIIACEMAARSCRAIELDPLYVDVAVRRWEEFTGQKASLERAS
jgi:DNA modification methylase